MRYLIIGNSAAGNAAAEAIRWHDARGDITILSDEPHASYYRPLLPFLIYDAPEGENLYRDALHTPPDVNVRLGTRVQAIAPKEKRVTLASGEALAYDKLLLATGASPIRPPIAGIQGAGVFVVRKLDDIAAIKAAAQDARRAVIIGGGRIGTKTALALRHRGIAVTIVEMLKWIVPQQLDAEGAKIFHDALRAEGIEMRFGRQAQRITRRGGKIISVSLDDGTRLPADFVVVATGVKPNADLARDAGITTRRGVLVNARLETNAPDVCAAGDVTETNDVVTGESVVSGIWTNAVAMGHIAGENMAGGAREYAGAFSLLNAMDVAGIPVISVGVIQPRARKGYAAHAWRDDGTYRKLVFRDDALVGVLLVGDIEKAGLYTTLIREHADVRVVKEAMLDKTFSYAHRLRGQAATTETYVG
ncbi:MAG: NAD(P)/FAD-dependent oxidoreductase [Chloroflexota bacterium]|nr:NAD(P)/FAD-dependent oxidoreductase [Chloroflexota bacterium]